LTAQGLSDDTTQLLIEVFFCCVAGGAHAVFGIRYPGLSLAVGAVALLLICLTTREAKAQAVAEFKIDLSSDATVKTDTQQPLNKSVLDETPLSLDLAGGEKDECVPGDGRPSAAQVSSQRKILSQTDDNLVVELSSRSYARGGHIRACDACVAKKCIGIENGGDPRADATATSVANISVRINSPLKRFRYELFVGHVDTDGLLSVSVTKPDGKALDEIPNRSSHFLLTETNRDVIVHAAASAVATAKGGCCDQTNSAKGILTVSVQPTAELDVNDAVSHSFEPFIAGGSSTTGYPYVVALGLDGRITCTGTYVGSHSVVTAAHCVFPVRENFKAHKLDVRFGSRFSTPDQIFQVASVDIPSDPGGGFSFNPETFEDDIALIQFAGDATSKPATLYTGDPSWSNVVAKKLPVDIVGFGFNVVDGNKEGIGFKREAQITIQRFENRKVFFGSQMANTCNGDSGGPLFVESENGKSLYLAGVTSGGDDNCAYGVDTRLDAFASWIKTRIQ
jgi:secreted trypsin-like serine protease